jgi:hypothetical protein
MGKAPTLAQELFEPVGEPIDTEDETDDDAAIPEAA